jgi:hypothetical protein
VITFADHLSGRYGETYLSELELVIERFAPHASRFLEWGRGESTKVFCAIAKTRPNPFLLSIDDNAEYIRNISKSLPLYPFSTSGTSICSALARPAGPVPILFFLPLLYASNVFVDGRRRAECALTASQVLAESGIVILHDWRRSRYFTIRALFETRWEGAHRAVRKASTREPDGLEVG